MMGKNYGSINKYFLFPILVLLNLYVFAQEKDQDNNSKITNSKDSLHYKADTNQWYKPHLTADMFNRFIENPGFCGSGQTYNYNTAFNADNPFYNLQEPGYHPFSFFTSFEFSAGKKKKSGFGSCFVQSREGPRIRSIIDNSFSYKIRLGKYNNLRFGVSLNIFYNSLDRQLLTFGDMIDQSEGFVYNSNEQLKGESDIKTWNINSGLTYSRKLFYFGFSALNLFKPLKDLHPGYYFFKHIDKTTTQFIISSGYTFELFPKVTLSPSAQMRFTSKELTADIHLTGVFWKHFIAGVSLNKLTVISADIGCSFWNIMTFYVSGGISADSELYHHFGPLDYVSANLRIQLGKYQEKF
jgi:type IX secretion system PorP/SprF family membrane protein